MRNGICVSTDSGCFDCLFSLQEKNDVENNINYALQQYFHLQIEGVKMGAVLVDNKAGILADEKSVLDVFSDFMKFIIFMEV